jgi:chromate transporter
LLISGLLPFWGRLAGHPRAARAIAGVSATVVGLLAAALYDPVWVSAVHGPADVAVAALALFALARWRLSVLWVALLCVVSSVLRGAG